MLKNQKIVVVMPAYNAEMTLRKTYEEIPHEIVDDIVLVDDKSMDHTVEVARMLDLHIIAHKENRGYGGNQKTCYTAALDIGADIIVMLHPDYQYTPKLITAMASLIAEDTFDCVLGSRILGIGAKKGGMPTYKYYSNRILTAIQNFLLNYKLSEYHTGYRAYSRKVLEALPLEMNSDNFIFDNQILTQIIYAGFRIGEISCPTLYMEGSSSINFLNSLIYGLGVLYTSILYRLYVWGIHSNPLFQNIKRVENTHRGPTSTQGKTISS